MCDRRRVLKLPALDRERESHADHTPEHRAVERVRPTRSEEKRDCSRASRAEERGREDPGPLFENIFDVLGNEACHGFGTEYCTVTKPAPAPGAPPIVTATGAAAAAAVRCGAE